MTRAPSWPVVIIAGLSGGLTNYALDGHLAGLLVGLGVAILLSVLMRN